MNTTTEPAPTVRQFYAVVAASGLVLCCSRELAPALDAMEAWPDAVRVCDRQRVVAEKVTGCVERTQP
jgi:hypothetical protein